MSTWSYIGGRIRGAREARHLSLRELADQLGTSHTTVREWEKGTRPVQFPDLERLARLLEKPVQFFLPGWYVDPSGLSPELAQLIDRLNNLPDGPVRDRVIRGFMEQIRTINTAMGGEGEEET